MKHVRTRLLIVGDLRKSRQSLTALLERTRDLLAVGYAATPGAARALLATGIHIDVAVIELDLSDDSGLELIRTVRTSRPTALVVVLMDCHDVLGSSRAVEAGAGLILNKTLDGAEISDVIHRICAVEPPISGYAGFATKRQFGDVRERSQPANEDLVFLTLREREILWPWPTD
jgi:DNA-binding NarL/FixJ family response regulator